MSLHRNPKLQKWTDLKRKQSVTCTSHLFGVLFNNTGRVESVATIRHEESSLPPSRLEQKAASIQPGHCKFKRAPHVEEGRIQRVQILDFQIQASAAVQQTGLWDVLDYKLLYIYIYMYNVCV